MPTVKSAVASVTARIAGAAKTVGAGRSAGAAPTASSATKPRPVTARVTKAAPAKAAPAKAKAAPAKAPANAEAKAQAAPAKAAPMRTRAKAAAKAPAKRTIKAPPAKATSTKAAAKATPTKAATKSVAPKPVPAHDAASGPSVHKGPARAASAVKAPAGKARAGKAAAAPTRSAPTTDPGAATSIAVPHGSEWTPAELADVRTQLMTELEDMQDEYERSLSDLNDLQRASTDGAGDDQADAGSKTFEREQGLSIAANRLDLLNQIHRAVERIDAGNYGFCESCGKPIPKARLKAFPMATLDVACKQREERR